MAENEPPEDDKPPGEEEPRVSPRWVDMVKAAMEARRRAGEPATQVWLAKAVGIGEASITRLIKHALWNSKVNRIADVLGIVRPYVLVSSDEEHEWITLGRRLYEANAAQFRELLGAVRKTVEVEEERVAARRELRQRLSHPRDTDQS